MLLSCIQGMRLYCFCGRFEKAYQSNIFKQLGSSSKRFVGVLLIQGLPYHSSLLPISEMDCAEASNSCQRICGMKIFTSKSWLMQNIFAISSGVIAISSWTKNILVFFLINGTIWYYLHSTENFFFSCALSGASWMMKNSLCATTSDPPCR